MVPLLLGDWNMQRTIENVRCPPTNLGSVYPNPRQQSIEAHPPVGPEGAEILYKAFVENEAPFQHELRSHVVTVTTCDVMCAHAWILNPGLQVRVFVCTCHDL